jgi:uncharacterized protein (DUF2249 family)
LRLVNALELPAADHTRSARNTRKRSVFMAAAVSGTKIDLRVVAPRSRSASAMYTSHLLRPGQTMEMIDEYDPVDLYIEFQRRPDLYGWHYLERGPKVWRVQVTRLQTRGSAQDECSDGCQPQVDRQRVLEPEHSA